MYKEGSLLFLYAETPLHPGSDTGVGAIDLPIQREAGTDLPVFHGSGIKGALRDAARETHGINERYRTLAHRQARAEDLRSQVKSGGPDTEQLEQELEGINAHITAIRGEINDRLAASGIEAVFGQETQGSEQAGAVSIAEGRVLLFPVRSLMGTFAWITSPLALGRLRRDLGPLTADVDWAFAPPRQAEALVPPGSDVRLDSGDLVLDEYSFSTREEPKLADIAKWLAMNALPNDQSYRYWIHRLYHCQAPEAGAQTGPNGSSIGSNLVVLPDDDFRDFCRFATEVQSRNKIDPASKTVAGTGLWTEEHLPAETLLYTKVLAADPRTPRGGKAETRSGMPEIRDASSVLAFIHCFDGKLVQMGGDATVGRGLVRIRTLPITRSAERLQADASVSPSLAELAGQGDDHAT